MTTTSDPSTIHITPVDDGLPPRGRIDLISEMFHRRGPAIALVAIVAVVTMLQTLLNPVIALLTGSAEWNLPFGPTVGIIVVAIGCIAQASALLLCYRWPLLALAGTLACYLGLVMLLAVPNWLTPLQIVVAGALFVVGARCKLPLALGGLGAAVLVTIAALFVWALDSGASMSAVFAFLIGQYVGFIALAAGGTGLGIWWGTQTRHALAARESLERDRAEKAIQLDRARRLVRLQIAQELHDVAGQHLSGLNSLADAAHDVAIEHPERALDLIDEIRGEGRFATASVYAALGDLRDEADDEDPEKTPGLHDLPALIEFWAQHGVPLIVEMPDVVAGVPAVVSTTMYRGAQEALTNAAKHAPGALVRVRVDVAYAQVVLDVENDHSRAARPPRATIGLGWGLSGLRRRVHLLHGTVETGETPTGGWRVRVVIPLIEAEDTTKG